MIDITAFSDQYMVRVLDDNDIPQIYALCKQNTLYYQYCPPFVTEDSIHSDMTALPPKKTLQDKYYVGYFDRHELVAVMDLIMGYPDKHTAFIGFFMTDVSKQSKGMGTKIITDLYTYLADIGVSFIRLGWVKGNPQAEHFWHKNGFTETGVTYDTGGYIVVVAQRALL